MRLLCLSCLDEKGSEGKESRVLVVYAARGCLRPYRRPSCAPMSLYADGRALVWTSWLSHMRGVRGTGAQMMPLKRKYVACFPRHRALNARLGRVRAEGAASSHTGPTYEQRCDRGRPAALRRCARSGPLKLTLKRHDAGYMNTSTAEGMFVDISTPSRDHVQQHPIWSPLVCGSSAHRQPFQRPARAARERRVLDDREREGMNADQPLAPDPPLLIPLARSTHWQELPQTQTNVVLLFARRAKGLGRRGGGRTRADTCLFGSQDIRVRGNVSAPFQHLVPNSDLPLPRAEQSPLPFRRHRSSALFRLLKLPG